MSLVSRNQLFDLDRFFNDSWLSAAESPEGSFFAPRVDIREADGHYEITAELPGVSRDDIHVHVKDGVLTLEAEARSDHKEEEGGKVIRQERRYGKLMRSFNLGADVNESDIVANFTDGVLKLTAPRMAEKAPERRRIEID